jgi:hypothetical protein
MVNLIVYFFDYYYIKLIIIRGVDDDGEQWERRGRKEEKSKENSSDCSGLINKRRVVTGITVLRMYQFSKQSLREKSAINANKMQPACDLFFLCSTKFLN